MHDCCSLWASWYILHFHAYGHSCLSVGLPAVELTGGSEMRSVSDLFPVCVKPAGESYSLTYGHITVIKSKPMFFLSHSSAIAQVFAHDRRLTRMWWRRGKIRLISKANPPRISIVCFKQTQSFSNLLLFWWLNFSNSSHFALLLVWSISAKTIFTKLPVKCGKESESPF